MLPRRLVLALFSLALFSMALVTLALFALAGPAMAARAAIDPTVDVLAVGATSGHRISLVTEVQPAPVTPLGASAVTVSAGGAGLAAQVTPVLSSHAAVELVVDASAAGASALQGGGLSGAASFLLQLPPDASTSVIADRLPPAVVAEASTEVTGALQATSALSGNGARATSDALTLALHQLPTGSDTPSVIVLYTNAPDAGGENATALGERLLRAHAILAVVNTSPDSQYWAAVATATGGLAVAAQPAGAVKAFDTVTDALHARYLLTFPRPRASAVQVGVRIDATAPPVTFAVPLPPEQAAKGTSSGAGLATAWRWALGALVLLAGAVLVLVALRRRRRPAPVEPGPDPKPPVESEAEIDRRPALPGVRVFDVANPAGPREITSSLFEPRAERDLREDSAADEAPAKDGRPNATRRKDLRRSERGGSVEVPRARRQGAEDRGVQ